MGSPVKVIIVDDSALIRHMLSEILGADPEIEIIDTASDPYDAREKIKRHNPDVITLDIRMPRMDGLTFLEKIMSLRPMPVVMVSTLTEKGAETTLRALEIGAVDYITKPRVDQETTLQTEAAHLIRVVKNAARARVRGLMPCPDRLTAKGRADRHRLIAIGASTGGVEALREILAALPADMPGILVTQHMPPDFTAKFAARLSRIAAIEVREAIDGDLIRPGLALIAPGARHMKLRSASGELRVELDDGAPVSGHKPSVDILFGSVAEQVGDRAIGVILTGMGSDGAAGLARMRDAGARTLGQDATSCVVYGMPKAANMAGAVESELPLSRIAARLVDLAADRRSEAYS